MDPSETELDHNGPLGEEMGIIESSVAAILVCKKSAKDGALKVSGTSIAGGAFFVQTNPQFEGYDLVLIKPGHQAMWLKYPSLRYFRLTKH